MEIYKNEEQKTVEIWLSNPERANMVLQEKLRECYKALAKEKYEVSVFVSGTQPLYENTFHLLQQTLLHPKNPKETPVTT